MFNAGIERAFKRAEDKGDLENLEGAGKPIAPSTLRSDPFAHVFQESGAMTPFGAIQRDISAFETRKAIEMEMWKRY